MNIVNYAKRIYRYFLALRLQRKALRYRKTLNIPIIAVTGTNGKTTTKELIAAVLSKKYVVYATQGNLNNHIGVPRTILSIPPEAQVAVIEMGASHRGEIAALCRIARPTMGVITNVGTAHLEGFGSFENVKRTKRELYDYLGKHGEQIFVDSDDDNLEEMLDDSGAKNVIKHSNWGLAIETLEEPNGPYLYFSYRGNDVMTHMVGDYNLSNACNAITIGMYFDVDEFDIVDAIADYVPTNHRSELIKSKRNTIVADCYNANPSSMAAAINNFVVLPSAPKCLILGDMLELGKESAEEHIYLLEQIVQMDFKLVLTAGGDFHRAAQTLFARQAPQNAELVPFRTTEELMDYLKQKPLKKYTILVKGSNAMQLERTLPLL